MSLREAAIRVGVEMRIFTGRRHHHAIKHAREAGMRREDIQRAEQGFVTDNGVFMGRDEALGYALAIGQIRKTKTPGLLCSEDLY
jgi:hypothetical protein